MSDFRDALKQAKLPEGTVEVCLRADLVADYETLTRQLEQSTPAPTLAGPGNARERAQLRDLEAQMRDATVVFRLRGLRAGRRAGGDPRPAWHELRAQHPPRVDGQGDMELEDRVAGGVNAFTIAEPLVRASVIDPDLTDAEWEHLFATITQSQFDDLVRKAWDLNQSRIKVPLSSPGSGTTSSSDAG